jgi:hypothetical protein
MKPDVPGLDIRNLVVMVPTIGQRVEVREDHDDDQQAQEAPGQSERKF